MDPVAEEENVGPDSYFERIDAHRYRPTRHAGGAWSSAEIHFSPLGGLIVHAIDRYLAERSETAMLLSRISFEILGFLGDAECEIRVETIRPGRTIRLVEATVLIADRPAVRARAWFLSAFDTQSIAGGASDRLALPEETTPWPMTSVWPGGFVASLEARPLSPVQPGRGTVWVTTAVTLVAGETAGQLAAWIALVDTANGIAVRQPPARWLFPNVDLTIHLHRQPEGRWTGLDTTVVFGATGQGVTSTVLHDVAGPVGFAHQSLTIRPADAGVTG